MMSIGGGYLGILDWGIGGLGLYNSIKATSPNQPILYFSDSGSTPYGKMRESEMRSRLVEVVDFMHQCGATHVAIACNAASSALPIQVDCQYTGVVEHGINAIHQLGSGTIGIIGGQRTITSNCYTTPFSRCDINIHQQIAQPLSNLIEQGDSSSEHLKSVLNQILAPLKECSHILLGCTHYAAITSIIQEILGDKVTLIDPVETMSKWIQSHWDLSTHSNIQDKFMTTGNIEATKSSAKKVFNVLIENVHPTNL